MVKGDITVDKLADKRCGVPLHQGSGREQR